MKLAYQASDQRGKIVTNTIEASDTAEAIERLRRDGLFVTEIAPATGKESTSPAKKKPRARRSGSSKKNLMMFTRQFYLLLSTGTPIVQALESLELQVKDSGWQEVIASIRKHVEDGNALSEAMAQYPQHFDSVYCSLIGAGETSGKLSVMLDRLASLTRKQAQIKNAITGAMVYPCLLVTIAVVVIILMLTFVLPRFETMFTSMDVPLPPSTQFLLWVSDILRTYWLAVLLGGGGLVVGGKLWLATSNGHRTVDTVVLNLPQFGRIIRNFSAARIARLLGILLDSHLPIIDVLGLVRMSMSNHHFGSLITNAEQAVIRGEPISTAFANSNLIEPTFSEALRSGEQSGQMSTSLLAIADFMDEENDVIVKSLTSILEPMILIVLGLLVGFMAISMFMPLFDMTAMG